MKTYHEVLEEIKAKVTYIGTSRFMIIILFSLSILVLITILSVRSIIFIITPHCCRSVHRNKGMMTYYSSPFIQATVSTWISKKTFALYSCASLVLLLILCTGPWVPNSAKTPSTAFVLLYKLFTLKLTVKQVAGMLNSQFWYVR